MRGHDAVAATAHRESAKVADRPISTTEWRQRIIGLHGELEDTVRSLEEKVAARRAAAGQLHLGVGSSPAEVEKLEAEERKLEHHADALRSAVEYGEAEIRRTESEERHALLEAQRQRRQAVAEQIQTEAVAADRLLVELASRLQAIKGLIRQYQGEGGAFHRSLPSCSARAALYAGLHDLLELGLVGGTTQHWAPLSQQLAGLAVVRGAELEAVPQAPTAA